MYAHILTALASRIIMLKRTSLIFFFAPLKGQPAGNHGFATPLLEFPVTIFWPINSRNVGF